MIAPSRILRILSAPVIIIGVLPSFKSAYSDLSIVGTVTACFRLALGFRMGLLGSLDLPLNLILLMPEFPQNSSRNALDCPMNLTGLIFKATAFITESQGFIKRDYL